MSGPVRTRSALTALLIFVPHIEWLRDHHFGPIGYAVDTALGAGLGASARVQVALGWLVEQLVFRGGLAFALLAVVAWQVTRSSPRSPPRHRGTCRTAVLRKP